MKHTKEIATAVGTLVIAIGIGFVMQSSEAAQEHYGKSARPDAIDPPAEPAPVISGAASTDILLQVEEVQLTSASDTATATVPVPSTIDGVERASAPVTDMPPAPDDLPIAGGCEISASATPIAGALVNLEMAAPCALNERLTVHHNGMMFTETTDASGDLFLTVPALTEEAVFILAFSNGDGAVVQATVNDIGNYDRVALQWRGQSGFELHAREFGADYGQTGHVWSGAAQDVDGMTTGNNGMLIRLGDSLSAEPLLAEVYTFPTGMAQQSGIVDLSVEAEVTAANCGQEIEAQSLEMKADGRMKTHDLTLSVPECDAIGSFLVLNNLVSDLKVASN